MASKALIVWGGWSGHEPQQVAELLSEALQAHDFDITLSDTLDAFLDVEFLRSCALVVPVWTMGKITGEQLNPLLEAVRGGVGLGGCHGGMCDSFREATEYQFMTGGQWVAHPGNAGVEYTVRITDYDHYITRESSDFGVVSEQYYMHVDPANRVLATTRFPTADGPHVPNGPVDMPVVWTRYYGRGSVFYCSLGHVAATVRQPEILKIMTRGLLWAAGRAQN